MAAFSDQSFSFSSSGYIDDDQNSRDDVSSVYSFASYDEIRADDNSLLPHQDLTSYRNDRRTSYRSYKSEDQQEEVSAQEMKEYYYPTTVTGPTGSQYLWEQYRSSPSCLRLPLYPPGGTELTSDELLSFRMFVRHMEEEKELIPETPLQRDCLFAISLKKLPL
ncbi:hypothetical protein KEM56_007575 [Ascosphaera pollenicola]|nr:hypothetical protein KEM56_007575 [Ascosphaera pollenicola]